MWEVIGKLAFVASIIAWVAMTIVVSRHSFTNTKDIKKIEKKMKKLRREKK